MKSGEKDVVLATPEYEDEFRNEVFVRSAYNYDMDFASEASGLRCEDPSLALQSAVEESDINTIVRRFGLTGQLPTDVAVPQFVDFEDVFDFQSAMNTVIAAEKAFMQLPADVRKRFNNDPQEIVAFVSDERNRDEAKKLGLLMPPPEPDHLLEAVRALKPKETVPEASGHRKEDH